MAPVARELAAIGGVLEPLQKAATIEGQLSELKAILVEQGKPPFTLIGFSWGGMLGFIFTTRNPSLVEKLILISSGAYEASYAASITETRLQRLTDEERKEALLLTESLDNPAVGGKDALLAGLGKLLSKADSYNPLPQDSEILETRYDINQSIWGEAAVLRSSGELLKLGRQISCPVVAIHGAYDPHPHAGVSEPLARTLKDFRLILLEKCGHYPWREREAKDRFYRILKKEAASRPG